MLNRSEDAELLAMFKIEGVALDSLNILNKNKTALDKLQTGEIAGMNGSIANQPFTLQKMGVPVRLIRPEDYGIDYIGDSLFTSEHERKENPRRVGAVRDAVLKGWRYALDNPNETITYILANYETGKTREQLLFEAAALRSIILPDLIDLGHVSHGRLGR
ncbi:GGDEF domain-containing protein, partial [bacterium]